MIIEHVDITVHTGTLRDKIVLRVQAKRADVNETVVRTVAGIAVEEMRAYKRGLQGLTEEKLADHGYEIAIKNL